MPRINAKSAFSPYPATQETEDLLNKISAREFNQTFQDACKIQPGENTWSDDKSISATSITDSIAVFTIVRQSNRITKIFAHHIGNPTDKRDIEGELDGYIKEKEADYEILIIGGDRGSEVLLKNIRAVIPKLFKKNYQISGEFLNIDRGPRNRSISANLQMDGTFTYCLN